MHRLLKRQIKQIYGKDFDINDFDDKALLLIENVTETYQNFDDEKVFLNHTIKENRKIIKEAYKNMLTSSRLAVIGEMMENITHQWKQPLSVILNLVSILKLDFQENKELKIIEEQTKYLDKTIMDFTNFSSHANEEKRLFSIEKSIKETVHIFDYQAQLNNININLNLEKEVFVQGDIGKFNQALLVIFSNAKDAFLGKKKLNRVLTVNSEYVENFVRIGIQDNAGGIDEDVIDKIFEPYFTTKFKDKGTGIGLSMTYNIVEKMQGSIKVENNADGALFTIEIPRKHYREDSDGEH